jgi:ATP-binding cassette subfamily C (CFTR/MRP) protein 1
MTAFLFKQMVKHRQAQMVIIDKRVRLLTEVINGIRAVKLYAYETFFGDKISSLRKQELVKLKANGVNSATMTATTSFIPTLAAVCESSLVVLKAPAS